MPPPLEIMADCLARHIGPESASFVHAVFSLHDPDALRNLATQAGFKDVDVRAAVTSLELPTPSEFLWQYVGSTPLAAVVARADEERRAALENEFSEKCRPFALTGTLAGGVKMTTLLATK
jgi:hypothetical protein